MDMEMKHYLIACVALALIAGCRKETHSGGAPASVTNPVREWCEANLADATQSFTVNAATGGIIYGADGVQVTFIPNAFLTEGGAPVSGSVQVKLVEALGIADMILMNKQTMGYDGSALTPLVSGGQIKVTASQGGEQLSLVNDGSIMRFPTSTVDPAMEVFYGDESSDGSITWDPAPPDVTLFADSNALYQFFNDTLDWVNCDYFYEPGGSSAVVSATPPAGHDATNTIVWLVFPDINAIAGLYNFSGGAFTTAPTYELPVGMDLVIVSLAAIGPDYYSSFTPVTVTAGMNVTLNYSVTTLTGFATACQALE